jgi:TonB family protein
MILLIDSALRATAILGAAWVITWRMPSASADERRRIWIVAFCAVAAIPAAMTLMRSWELTPAGTFQIEVLSQVAAAASGSGVRLVWVSAVWAAGCLFVLLRLALGCVTLARWTGRATASGSGVFYSDATSVPLTWGLRRPAILLPTYMKTWTDDARAMVLRHEQAHIDGHDWGWRLLARVVTAVFWFHPLAWIADAGLRQEIEEAADDAVLAGGTSASDYAAGVLAVARRLGGALPSGAMAMVYGSSLDRRITHMLDPARRRSRANRRWTLATVAAAAALGVSLAAVQDGRVYRIGENGLVPPRLVYEVKAQYGPEAMADKVQGSVLLTAGVTEEGVTENVLVVASLHDELDANAVAALEQWRFEPGRRGDGAPVRVSIDVEMTFTLK